MSFARNNLDQADSPYLYQHRDNPVHWQEWSDEALQYARENDKILLVSVGYSTCHWCHVMAAEAFSDSEIAAYLNEHFLPIKVDREQRPDIDQYMMSFLVASTGQGGWPLNAFLSPELEPFFAMTYAPVKPKFGMPGFLDILQRIKRFYDDKKHELRSFEPGMVLQDTAFATEDDGDDEVISRLATSLSSRLDRQYGGFGTAQKFPPHSSLAYMQYHQATADAPELHQAQRLTLDMMQLRGLHDHLQGGIFRYCVDRQWTVPHFEKMLYDQAMALWYYSAAARELDDDSYARTARGILRALKETFAADSHASGTGPDTSDSGVGPSAGALYFAGHDADTDHEEGATYLWSLSEIRELLSTEEAELAERVFDLTEEGNFEGKNHLVRKVSDRELSEDERNRLDRICEKLLAARKERRQPFTDRKIITSWNALAGIGLVGAYRFLGVEEALEDARRLLDALLAQHTADTTVYHSSIDGQLQRESFLGDHAALLLLMSYLHEDTRAYEEELRAFRDSMERFRGEQGWIESDNPDFIAVPAEQFDSPIPSSVSMAELAGVRVAMLLDEDYGERSFRSPGMSDFANIAALASRGYMHVVKSPEPVSWSRLPIHTVLVPAERVQDCYKGVCTPQLPGGAG